MYLDQLQATPGRGHALDESVSASSYEGEGRGEWILGNSHKREGKSLLQFVQFIDYFKSKTILSRKLSTKPRGRKRAKNGASMRGDVLSNDDYTKLR